MMRLLVRGAQPGQATLVGPPLHYLARVLRVAVGDALEVFDGEGTSFEARVEALTPEAATLALGPARRTRPPRAVTIVQGLPKGDKLELVLQKGTELGAAAFIAAAAERSVVKLEGKEAQKQARWQRIVEEAARQCGRPDVPVVSVAASLKEAVASLAPGTKVLVLDESEHTVTLSQAFAPLAGTEVPVAFVVGPEGGLSRAEVEALKGAGASPVSLGKLILRTETAALAGLAVLRHLDGELG